jgi:hypothetical protein
MFKGAEAEPSKVLPPRTGLEAEEVRGESLKESLSAFNGPTTFTGEADKVEFTMVKPFEVPSKGTAVKEEALKYPVPESKTNLPADPERLSTGAPLTSREPTTVKVALLAK